MANNDHKVSAAAEADDEAERFIARKPLTALAIALLVGALAAKILF
jgi:hypothetical protein